MVHRRKRAFTQRGGGRGRAELLRHEPASSVATVQARSRATVLREKMTKTQLSRATGAVMLRLIEFVQEQ
ncbi:MAG TPA: hypothetical protein VKD22_14450 [Ramlibacter sp.]|nr:hypothetical protein [Ramlibacter sp.]